MHRNAKLAKVIENLKKGLDRTMKNLENIYVNLIFLELSNLKISVCV